MNWNIKEDYETLVFTRFIPESKLFIEIELDHGENTNKIFSGKATGENNEIKAVGTGQTFLGCLDTLLRISSCPF